MGMFRWRLGFLLGCLGVFCASGPALAQSSQPQFVWGCWYDGDVGVLCRLGENPDSGDGPGRLSPSTVGASPMPLDVPRLLLESPQDLMGYLIRIPLYSVPIDMADVRELANSVMCGRDQRCAVAFGRNYAEAAMALAQRFSIASVK